MDREHLGSLLFLSSMAASALGCASGTAGPAPRPGPFVTHGGDDGGASGDTWTDPLETSGTPTDSDGSGGDDDWPSEGETGSITDGTSGGVDDPPDDSGATGVGSTSDPSGGESSSGGYDEGTTGYDPPAGGDPCPDLAQLYSDCNPEYLYSAEIELCNQARAQAQSISPGCGAAHAEYLACLSTLDCATLLQAGTPFPCLIQGAATDIACS